MYKVNCSPFLYIIDKVSHTGINQLTIIQSTYSLVTLLQLYPQHQTARKIPAVLQSRLQEEQPPQGTTDSNTVSFDSRVG